MGDWHNEYFKELGWLEPDENCKASISGLCLAITQNEPFCYPECEIHVTMDGTEYKEGDA